MNYTGLKSTVGVLLLTFISLLLRLVTLSQQKTTFVYRTNVVFLNDVCLRLMISGKHRNIATNEQHFTSEGYSLSLFRQLRYVSIKKVGIHLCVL